MASTVERRANGEIIYRPDEILDIPNVDLITLLFESEICRMPPDTIIHADAAEPSYNLTKARLVQQFKRAANVFRYQYGIGANGPDKDVVFNISTGHFMIPVVFYAAITAGGIFSAASPAATPDEIAYQLRATDTKVVVCTADMRETAIVAAEKVGLSPRNILVYGGTRDFELREAVSGAKVPISNQELDWRHITDRKELENSVICVLFSSGTTGLPKAMPLSHWNSVASCTLVVSPTKKFNATKPGHKYVDLAHLPVAHIAGIQNYFVNKCYLGGTLYWMPRFDFPKFCEYAKKYGVSMMFTVPPIYVLIAESPLVKDHFDAWDDAVSGAAPMGQDLQVEASRKLGKGASFIRQTWGLSETSGSVTIIPPQLIHQAPHGSVGSLVPNCYARIVDDNEKDVEPGERGEASSSSPRSRKAPRARS
ncbi:hypothetical protein F5B18DRAFT_611734 [Nemania serpens]|nr:hypothetical protein F5B18DRAFT_611734 [Nemania serpens]